MSYRSTSDEAQFYLNQVLGFDRVQGTERFADATPDTVEAILSEAGKLCEDVLYPINRNGDLEPAHLENGVVRTSPGFADAYKSIAEGGWVSICADPENGGMGLPQTLVPVSQSFDVSGAN